MNWQRITWEDMREGWLRIAGLWQTRRRERELAEEMEFHLAMKQRNYRENHGLSDQQASERARRDFGGFERWKEVCRDVARWRVLEEFTRDLVLAWRMLRKSPVFTVVALVTLTLAIGATTAIFSLMNTLVLKSLPAPQAGRLTILRVQPDERGGYSFSYPLLKQLEAQSGSLMKVFAFTGRTFQMQGQNGVEQVAGQLVSGQYFSALGVQPEMGRWINASDDQPGTPSGAVAVVSHRFWRTRMNADSQALGRVITVNKTVCTVVGVMPETFRGMSRDTQPDVFVPMELEPSVDAPFNSIKAGFGNWWLRIAGRLNDGVSLVQLNAFLKTSSHRILASASPDMAFVFNGHKLSEFYLLAESGANGYSNLRWQFQRPLTVLMGLVAIVLLIACLNLAALLMARSAARTREITTRLALGASRGRLIQQLLTESLLLSLVGAAFGLAAAPALAHFIAAILAPQHGPADLGLDVSLDSNVFAFAAAVTILATVITGTLPALRSTRRSLHSTQRGTARRQLWPRILLSGEVALALMLVSGASLLGYSLLQLHRTPAGFEAKGLVYLPLDMHKRAEKGAALIARYRNMVEHIHALPGVNAVSISAIIPLSDNVAIGDVKVPNGSTFTVWNNRVGPNYFGTMGTSLLEGREFRWTDTDATGTKVILSEAAARLLFPNGRATGRRVSLDDGKTLTEVIGVVKDSKYDALRNVSPPTAYSSAMQDVEDGSSFTILARTSGDPAPLIAAGTKIVRRFVPDIPPPVALSMEQIVADSLATERIMATLALFFGGIALLMTGIGLYGTLAYATERRTSEIGIRLALGARRSHVISLVSSENVVIAATGCLLGTVVSLLAAKAIASFLFGVSARDPLIFLAAAVLLLSVAAAASLAPAMKAARIDPIAAIRCD